MFLADSIPPTEFWGLMGGLVLSLGSVIAILGRQLEKQTAALESLQQSMIDKAVPVIERSIGLAQTVDVTLKETTVALGASTEATKASVTATTEMLRWVAILTDRESRSRRGT